MATRAEDSPFGNYLEVRGVSAGYGAQTVIRDISIRAERGQMLGVIGPNGSGKSSLIRAISGTLALKRGRVILNGVNLATLDARQRARRIAVVPQGIRLPEAFTVKEVVLIGRSPYLSLLGKERAEDLEAARRAMEQTDVAHLAHRLIGELSGGEQQRVLVARALAQQPQVLLLDEATAHLDLKYEQEILTLVRRMARECGLIVIAAMHDLNLAGLYADRLCLLREGELLAVDAPSAVLTPPLIERAFQVTVVVTKHPLHSAPLLTVRAE